MIINWIKKRILKMDKLLNFLFQEQSFLDKLVNNKLALEKIMHSKKIRDSILNSPDILALLLTDQRALDEIFSAGSLLDKVLLDSRSLERMISNSEALSSILSKDKKEVLSETELINALEIESQKNIYLNKVRKLKNTNIKSPCFIVSYPRSGSNFLQSVLTHSSGFHSSSIYAYNSLKPTLYKSQSKYLLKPNELLTLKSHSITPAYFHDEVQRFGIEMDKPEKIIFLIRDPRDVLISFYEFVQIRNGIKIEQFDFLYNTSFYYATYFEKDLVMSRKTEIAPLNIIESYKKFINHWYDNNTLTEKPLLIRYENLVNTPDDEFSKIFSFLNLDCALDPESLDRKVSLYSNNNRTRGIAGGHRTCYEDYATIIDIVNKELKTEISKLGYDI